MAENTKFYTVKWNDQKQDWIIILDDPYYPRTGKKSIGQRILDCFSDANACLIGQAWESLRYDPRNSFWCLLQIVWPKPLW